MQVLYFVKEDQSARGREQIGSDSTPPFHFGVYNGEGLDALLRLMRMVYLPVILGNNTWPEEVKREFSLQVGS